MRFYGADNDRTEAKVITTVWCVCLVIFVSAKMCLCRPPVVPETGGKMSPSAVTLAVDFLTKYGYLKSSDLEAGNLRTEDQLRHAIRTMQRFGNIPQTGRVDEATLRLMKKPRCGVPDMIGSAERLRRYALQGQRWSNTNLTWSVKDPYGKTEPEMVQSQLSRAFKVWSDASVLTFTEVETKADIVVSFLHGSHGDGYPFDGEGAVLAHAFFPGEGIGGDAHFDAEEKWLPQQPVHEEDGVNLFAVAAHEIGHSLGLSHSSTPGSLMFPYYQIVDGHFELPADDANGIQQLYGEKPSKKWATMPAAYSTPAFTATQLATRPTKPITRKTTKSATSTTTTKMPTRTTAKLVTRTTTKPLRRLTTTMFIPPKRRYGNTKLTTVLPTQPTYTTTTPTTEELLPETTESPFPDLGLPPDTCNTSIDAISVIRREVFIFKGKYFWRLDPNKKMKPGYPAPIGRFWYNLPQTIERIDALYERPIDTKIVFFSGRQYWLFAANQLVSGYPKPLTDLGLPSYVDRVDAAMVWGHNGKTYFFSGRQYWKFDEIDGAVELDYPRDIAAWRGVPYNIDAAFQWTDGSTYFFKGNNYWQFNDVKMKVHPVSRNVNKFWFGCRTQSEKFVTSSTTEMPLVLHNTDDGRKNMPNFHYVVILTWFHWNLM